MPCNLCGGADFAPFRGRTNELCTQCGAKARHRVAMKVYQDQLWHLPAHDTRTLHMAPEAALHDVLKERFGAGYITSDPEPLKYPHAEVISLWFPVDFKVFPDGYFNVILHNHVMEHLPGTYKDHLVEFIRLLAPGGMMIFSVPGPYMDKPTIEGGEHFASDKERLERFLQEDHFKQFGNDFEDYLKAMDGGELVADGVSDADRAAIQVRPGKARMFLWRKAQ